MTKFEPYLLHNGVEMPALGAGTWQIPNEAVSAPVECALKLGYRHIDTAAGYRNEEGVGAALRASGLPREEVFITTKLPAEIKGRQVTIDAFEGSLQALGLSYVDLYLIHAPWPWDDMGRDCTQGNLESWRAMEELYEAGKIRAIGVSNFAPAHLEPLLAQCQVKPMVNQISFYPGHIQRETAAFCREQGIFVEAYAPLATGAALSVSTVQEIARAYQVSPAQLCIRYCLQKGTAAIPKSTHPERLRENAELDFTIRPEDMSRLDALDQE